MSLRDRFRKSWNAFTSKDTNPQLNDDPTVYSGDGYYYGIGSVDRPDRPALRLTNERSIVSSLYNKIAVDVSAIGINHVRLDNNGRFKEVIDSGLNECLTVQANIDQTGRQLILDAVISMFDEGTVAIVPVETSSNPTKTDSYDIHQLRTGRITDWFPDKVKVLVYNERIGKKQEIVLPKRDVAIIENPFYIVMNEPNSTLKRLIRKTNLLDTIDDKANSSKLDLLFKLPYKLNSSRQKEQAKTRKKELEEQLVNDPYGIAYIDATETVTQLNRPVENKLLEQIDDLTNKLYSQIGVTKSIFEGTADEQENLNYHNETLEPILSAITNEMTRKFLTKTARTQGQSIIFIKDPFKLVPINKIADIADKFTRNEILASNDIRAIVGYKPVDDPRANELRNKNLNASAEQLDNPIMVEE